MPILNKRPIYLSLSLSFSLVKDFRLPRFTQPDCSMRPFYITRFNGIFATVHGSMGRLSVGGRLRWRSFHLHSIPSFLWTQNHRPSKLLIISAWAKTICFHGHDFKISSFAFLSRRNQGIRHFLYLHRSISEYVGKILALNKDQFPRSHLRNFYLIYPFFLISVESVSSSIIIVGRNDGVRLSFKLFLFSLSRFVSLVT